MRGRDGGGSGFLIAIAVLLGFIFFGPSLANQFSASAGEVFLTMAPIVGPIAGVILAVLLVRHYWSRS